MTKDLADELERLANAVTNAPTGPDRVNEWGRLSALVRGNLLAILSALRGEEWQGIETAPKDGTPILAWCVHPHARYATDTTEWAAPVVTQWTLHNGGGWTWNGLAGTFTHWRPLPPPPKGTDHE